MYSKLNLAIEAAPSGAFIYSKETPNSKYLFGFCDDLEYFIEQYQSCVTEDEKRYYEVFLEDRPLKLFFDIDVGKKDQLLFMSASDVYREFQLFIADFHRVVLRQIIPVDLMILDSSVVSGKISLHIQDLNNHWVNVGQMKQYYSLMKEFLDRGGDNYKYMKFIDFGICTKNRSMRMIGSHKLKSPERVLTPAKYCCNTLRYPSLCKEWFATHIGSQSKKIVLKGSSKKTKKEEEGEVGGVCLYPEFDDKEMLNQCRLAVSVLKPATAQAYKSWYAIGSALYTTLGGSREGLNLWLDFSAKSPDSFNKEECIEMWERGNMNGYKYGTLIHYFNQDKERIFLKRSRF